MAIEIVDFPINSMVIFHSYVSHYQRVNSESSLWHQGATYESPRLASGCS